MVEQLVNSYVTNDNTALPDTVLDNGGVLGAGDTTCTVLTLPPGVVAAPFRIKIDDEVIRVGTIGGTGDKDWSDLTRDMPGTTGGAASHADGSNVYMILTAETIIDNIHNIEVANAASLEEDLIGQSLHVQVFENNDGWAVYGQKILVETDPAQVYPNSSGGFSLYGLQVSTKYRSTEESGAVSIISVPLSSFFLTANGEDGNLDTVVIVDAQTSHNGGGDIASLIGIKTRHFVNSAGAVTDLYGMIIGSPFVAGAVDNIYGLEIHDQGVSASPGSDLYNLVSRGATSKNLFEGQVQAGGTVTVNIPQGHYGDNLLELKNQDEIDAGNAGQFLISGDLQGLWMPIVGPYDNGLYFSASSMIGGFLSDGEYSRPMEVEATIVIQNTKTATEVGILAVGMSGSSGVVSDGAGSFADLVYGLRVGAPTLTNVTATRYLAALFEGAVEVDGYIEGIEMAAPAEPPANGFRIYAKDTGGKTELLALFSSGAAQQLAIQP